MTSSKHNIRLTARALRTATVLALAYTLLIFILPAHNATLQAHGLSQFEYKLLYFIVRLPLIAAWFAAFLASAKLFEYVAYIRKTPEGPCFELLAKGCTWLAWSLPIPAFVGLLMGAAANHWEVFTTASIIIGNYLNLILPLVAFLIIGFAARGLVSGAKLNFSFETVRVVMLLFLAAGVLYCYLIFQRLDLASLGSTNNPYRIPIWLLVLTIVIPYLYAWFVGLLAAYEVSLFGKQVNGVLYRHALRWFAGGLAIVILSLISQQYVNAVIPRVGHLVLNGRLMLVVICNIVAGTGFLLIYYGAAKLKRIEEV